MRESRGGKCKEREERETGRWNEGARDEALL